MKKPLLLIFIVVQCILHAQDLEHSWVLFPDTTINNYMITTSLIETNDGNYIVPIYNTSEYCKSDEKATIIKISSDGAIMNETRVDIEDDYLLNDIVLDIWNDTVNVFMHCIGIHRNCAKIMHSYLLDDFSMTEHRELWYSDFEKPMTSNLTASFPPLIDKDGNRTISYTYSSYVVSGVYPYYGKTLFLKLDANCNPIVDKLYDCDDLNYHHIVGINRCMFNQDTTGYNVMYHTDFNPWKCLYILDDSLNLIDTVYYEADDIGYWNVTIHGNYAQSPFDGMIYCMDEIHHPYIGDQIVAYKLDAEEMKVKFLQCTDSPEDISHLYNIGGPLCFAPNGDIYGIGTYDDDHTSGDPEYECSLYIVKFIDYNGSLIKLKEWYYSIGDEYNHSFRHVYYTKTDDIIVTGRVVKDYNSMPCIVKFSASILDNIEEAHAHGFKAAIAYPNPGSDMMNVRTTLRDCILKVYDIHGKIVYQEEVVKDVTTIDASKWSSGTYVWRLVTATDIIEEGKWIK